MKRLLTPFLLGAWLCAGAAAAAPLVFVTALSGPAEFPPNASPATGIAIITIDPAAHTLALHVEFSGLIGTTTVAHIHCCTAAPFSGAAGVATTTPTFAGFPAGVSAGVYDVVLDTLQASTFNAAFVTAQGSIAAAEAALFNGLITGRAYLNIHSSAFQGGEIRGFTVPEPASLALAAMALLAVACVGRRRTGAHAKR